MLKKFPYLELHVCCIRDFPRTDLGPNIGPFPHTKWEKTSQNGIYHSQFFCFTFFGKFHENLTKNSKVTDVNIFMQIFMSILWRTKQHMMISYGF